MPIFSNRVRRATATLVPAVLAGAVVAGLVAGSVGCSSAPRPPDLGLIYNDTAQAIGDDRTPVVVIPGILGTRLESSDDGRVVWGAFTYGAADTDRPDGARLVTLPMAEGVPLRELRDDVVPAGVLDHLEVDTLGVLRGLKFDAYVGILSSLAAGDYRDEQVAAGMGIDYGGLHWTCFQCGYDWRRDVAESAEILAGHIEDAQAVARYTLGLPEGAPVKVDVIAHSMGGLVLRYYLRYGTQPMPEDGSLPELTWAGAENVRHAVLVGTPNAGSVYAVRELIEGKNLNPIAPNYRPAILGTMPSVYQLMPRTRHARVVDEDGRAVDLYDPAVWDGYGWGLASTEGDRVLSWILPDATPDERERIAFDHLVKSLARAEQFHRALDVPASPPPGTTISLFVGDSERTGEVLVVDDEGRVRISEYGPGDGTVARESALMDERVGGEYEVGLRSPVGWGRVQFLSGTHLGITTAPEFTNNLLFLLLESATGGDDGSAGMLGG